MSGAPSILVVFELDPHVDAYLPLTAFPVRNRKMADRFVSRRPDKSLILRELTRSQARDTLARIDNHLMGRLECWSRFFDQELTE